MKPFPSTLVTSFRRILLALFALLIMVPVAQAQFLPGTTTAKEESGSALETIVKQAERDGSTVIVVQPKSQTVDEPTGMSAMRAEQFLKARQRINEIIDSAPTLFESGATTLRNASPDGTYFWLGRALATAALGLLLAMTTTRAVFRWASANFNWINPSDPQNLADKVRYLVVRTCLSLALITLSMVIVLVVAIVLDSGHEPSRRLIFEFAITNAIYRFLRHGVSWNLFAGDMPDHRLVNLTNDEARTIHRDFHVGFAFFAVVVALTRFFSFTGEDQIAAGLTGGLTADHILFMQLCSAVLATLGLILFTIKNWKAWRHVFAPRDPMAAFYKLRTGLAGLVPVISIVYGLIAMGMFAYRLALGQPAPSLVISAPFFIFYSAIIVYAVILLIIDAFYQRRTRIFEQRAAAARAAHEADVERLKEKLDDEAGEEMLISQTPVEFEFQPAFRQFFEGGALAIIVAVSLGELGRVWGVDVGGEGNRWAAILDIILAAILCWLAYRAVSIFIDRRLEEEGGVPESDEEMGGEGGGAGATRMATLLPIMRYVMVITLFAVGGMVILSRMGFDIGPIFAGAGVVGIAVGFGAQTLIRDVFSGAFFLMDDAFRKGEYVEIEGIKGTVEKISIRSFQLRHHLGALHTIPFGEIKQLTNYSRDWVLMKLPLRVTYDTDVEKVRKLVKKLGQQLLEHPQVGHTFMQPLKSQGVYKMEDSAMIIRVKFMTKPGEQFVTRKVVYESIQDLFAREGIHFAHKEVTVRLADGQKTDDLSEEERKALTSAARTVIDDEEASKAGAKAGGGGDR